MTHWKYEALRIAVLYVLREEGAHTCAQLTERIGATRSHIGLVLRNLLSSGKITADGHPKLYDIADDEL